MMRPLSDQTSLPRPASNTMTHRIDVRNNIYYGVYTLSYTAGESIQYKIDIHNTATEDSGASIPFATAEGTVIIEGTQQELLKAINIPIADKLLEIHNQRMVSDSTPLINGLDVARVPNKLLVAALLRIVVNCWKINDDLITHLTKDI